MKRNEIRNEKLHDKWNSVDEAVGYMEIVFEGQESGKESVEREREKKSGSIAVRSKVLEIDTKYFMPSFSSIQ